MRAGYTTIIFSAELDTSIPLSHSAHNMHANFRDITERTQTTNPNETILLGDSRGAMIGFGFLAYARENGIEVPDSFLVDPCMAKSITQLDPKQIVEYAAHCIEPYSLVRQVGRLSARQALHYMRTVKPHPQWLKQQLRVGRPLSGGEAGDLGRNVSPDQVMKLLLFKRSAANHAKEWAEIFREHSEVEIITRNGTHISILNQRTRALRQEFLESCS